MRASLYALLGLAACQKHTLPEPESTISTRSDDDRAKFFGKIYTLTKHGNASLSYGNDGRLNKVTYETGAISHVTYTPGFFNSQSVQVIAYLRSNNKMSQNTKFLVDASGRCYEEQTTHYWYNANAEETQSQNSDSHFD
ncbi:MAG: hypothetical protein LH606_05750 [Cytophagaceae bacterium]|nr:hypothetical protein [Cytophagaceae bacterium]